MDAVTPISPRQAQGSVAPGHHPDPLPPSKARTAIAGCLPIVAAAGLLLGCQAADSSASRHPGPPPTHVDSILPIEEEIRRFRATLGRPSEQLSGGAPSIDSLTASFVTALANADIRTLRSLLVSAEEFAYLYYPESRHTRPPYELSPALLWFQLENAASRGLDRALQGFGGRQWRSAGHSCGEDAEPLVEGRNRVWHGCTVRLEEYPAGETIELPLFGPVLERDGRFKFLSYANRL